MTIVDLDYYLLWFDAFREHLFCTPKDGILSVGYNRYVGTVDEDKFPIYLMTGVSSVLAQFINPAQLSFERWIVSLEHFRSFDQHESPFGLRYGSFSDESLFRALLSKYALRSGGHPKMVWIATPKTWKRVHRGVTEPLGDLNDTYADVFPKRPLSNCTLYADRLLPVHRKLSTVDPQRDADFLDFLRHLKVHSQEWGSAKSQLTPA